MLSSVLSRRGLFSAPHHRAAAVGASILAEGGNAAEAMVAAAAMISVCYPHMNGLGGDGFWLLRDANGEITAIAASGPAARAATLNFYLDRGQREMPTRGPRAAMTMAGTVSGWDLALQTAAHWGGRIPLERLLAEAFDAAEKGITVTRSQNRATVAKLGELKSQPGFAPTFIGASGSALVPGAPLRQPRLANSLKQLARAGLDDFYRGDLARSMAGDLQRVGSPLALQDFESYRAQRVSPLSVKIRGARLVNLPPPTQGLASLMILGMFDHLKIAAEEGFPFIHGLVEATKAAFEVRDHCVTDPAYSKVDFEAYLRSEALLRRASALDPVKAAPWSKPMVPGDTIWMGAIDGEGRAVSFIQSLYWEYGSGVVLPDSGIVWQNRGSSFSLSDRALNRLAPGRYPFQTIQPALAEFDDGRIMVYGCMGGDGQPQTQAAVFARYAMLGQDLQAAITAPRWLIGRTWGAMEVGLRLEDRFAPALLEALRTAGHDLQLVGPFDEIMGHAGAAVRRPDGVLEGASDPRSDGAVAAL